MKYQIVNGNVLLPSGLSEVNLVIDNGVIVEINKKTKILKSLESIDVKKKIVLPSFIDIHTNGIAGFDLTNGLYNLEQQKFSINKSDYLIGLNTALKTYAKHGTTLVGFTTLEASLTKLKRIFSLIADYKNNSESPYHKILHGIYMEGTFMKDKEFKGAHNPKYFFEPSIKLFKELQKVAKNNIKIVNVVPEWGSKALALIDYLSKNNILCAAGHTSASGVQYNKAIEKGLKLAIHVLNGPSSSSFKPFENGGALESFLRSDDVSVEIIPDGYHVDKSYFMDIVKRKGIERSVAISDSMFVTSIKKIKEFSINGVSGIVSKNGEYIHIAGKENINSLFGSSLTMDKAFSNILTWLTQPIEGIWHKTHLPMKFEDALISASKMCSENPAKLLSSSNDNINQGSIIKGNKANLIIGQINNSSKKYQLKIDKVLLEGNLVYKDSYEEIF